MMRKILIVQCRGLGDAVISTTVVNSIYESWHNVLIDIWASQSVAAVFKNHPSVNKCYIQHFPVIRRHRFTWSSINLFIFSIRQLRGRQYDLCLNLTGDIRENILTSLVGARETWTIEWSEDHPFRKAIYPALTSLLDHTENLHDKNIYSAYQNLVTSMGCDQIAGPSLGGGKKRDFVASPTGGVQQVGIHPLAGNACREWPFQKWNRLLASILELGFDVVVFGAPAERERLIAEFGQWCSDTRVLIRTCDLDEFFDSLRSLVAFVGLDSFGIHAAYALGIPSVLINGGNDPETWAPPGAFVLGDGGGCKYYPCYNHPKCSGAEGEFVCVREVEVADVVAALETLVDRKPFADKSQKPVRPAISWFDIGG